MGKIDQTAGCRNFNYLYTQISSFDESASFITISWMSDPSGREWILKLLKDGLVELESAASQVKSISLKRLCMVRDPGYPGNGHHFISFIAGLNANSCHSTSFPYYY